MRNNQKKVNNSLPNLKEIVVAFVSDLPDRSEQILVKRYGLDGNRKKTLEQIGKEYGITRERVRQIESASIKDAKKSANVVHLRPAEELIESIILDHGHIMEHGHLVRKTQELTHDDTHDNHIEFVLDVSDKFQEHKENEHLKKGWYIKSADLDAPKKFIDSFVEFLEEKNEPISQEMIVDELSDHEVAERISEYLDNEKRIHAYLHLGKRISSNPYQEWGLSHWNEIMPRGVKDKAYIVLKKEAKPLHFTEITDKINESGFSKRKAVPQTVHNELIKDERFVLVGRGIYALVSWGYKPGTVADVVLDVLSKSNRPLSKEEIIEEVLKQRIVKKNTIVLALQNNAKIKKDRGRFVFVEQLS